MLPPSLLSLCLLLLHLHPTCPSCMQPQLTWQSGDYSPAAVCLSVSLLSWMYADDHCLFTISVKPPVRALEQLNFPHLAAEINPPCSPGTEQGAWAERQVSCFFASFSPKRSSEYQQIWQTLRVSKFGNYLDFTRGLLLLLLYFCLLYLFWI